MSAPTPASWLKATKKRDRFKEPKWAVDPPGEKTVLLEVYKQAGVTIDRIYLCSQKQRDTGRVSSHHLFGRDPGLTATNHHTVMLHGSISRKHAAIIFARGQDKGAPLPVLVDDHR